MPTRKTPARRRTAAAVTTAAERSSKTPPNRSWHAADRDIARRAFERYEERGRERGHDIDDWLQAERDLQDALGSIVGCYPREMPGLQFTREQLQRLCGIGRTMCQMVLESLVNEEFLCAKSDGHYTRLTDGHRPHPAKADLRTDTRSQKAS
jgi:hypothetical protein